MTIKDAIDRAKLLKRARLQEQQADHEPWTPAASTGIPAEPRPGRAEIIHPPPVPLQPLRIVEISADACARHRVLLTDAQMREMPEADAAYRLLRSRVQHRLNRNNWFSLAVVSPGKDDGKTVTALNLAISIAREKQRPVYVLDLDMRNPSVCSYLGLQDMRALPDYFTGDAEPADVLVQTSFPYLFVAGGHTPVAGASEMLSGPRWEQLLAHIRLRSPDALVIIDLPPVGLTDEAAILAPRVDALLIVASEGKTQRDGLARAIGVLSEFTVAGVVLNRSSDRNIGSYQQYYG
jgi:Mrp family chromosome partitioning ATPase